jgi:hypothetical protein
MNFSIKKMFCAALCGALFLTAVPAQAFSFNFDYVTRWFTPKMAIATAAVTAAGLLAWKYFGSKKIGINSTPAPKSKFSILITKLEDLQNLNAGDTCDVANGFAANDGIYNFMVSVGSYTVNSVETFNNNQRVMYELMNESESYQICMNSKK